MRAGRHQRAADGQMPVPLRLSRSVIDSVGPAGAEFSLPNIYCPCKRSWFGLEQAVFPVLARSLQTRDDGFRR